jgi:membrane protease YdiL (CAAX protease family)
MITYFPYIALFGAITVSRLSWINPSILLIFTLPIIGMLGLLSGAIMPMGLLGIALLTGFSYLSTRSDIKRILRIIAYFFSGVLALAIAMHQWPGFVNYVVVKEINLTERSTPFTLYANLDKGIVGLILLTFFCVRIDSSESALSNLRKITVPAAITIVSVFGLGLSTGLLRFDLAVKDYLIQFLFINLFLVCVAEEVFFRGFMQEALTRVFKHWKNSAIIALIICSFLFGLVHFNGKFPPVTVWTGVFLATLAGFGYGYVYMKTRRIEYSVLLHFCLNALHIIVFTYPSFQQ